MNEHPILFSTPMVQANLEGRKTMTRRIIKIAPESKPMFQDDEMMNNAIGYSFLEPDQFEKPDYEKMITLIKCQYGQPGDLLWVRESFALIDHPELKYRYKADHLNPKSVNWKPSIHMPKAAARIWLQVEEIRVERLNDISEEDAIAEGITSYFDKMVSGTRFTYQPGQLSNSYTAKREFEKLWCKINGEESWEANPWVWVVKYKVVSTTGKPNSIPQ